MALIRSKPTSCLCVCTQAVAAVDEFASRLFEEMDFANEVSNLHKFNALYGRGGSVALPPPGVRVPGVLPSLCSRNIIVMEVRGSFGSCC